MGRKRIAGVNYTVYAHTQKQCLTNLKKAIKVKKEKNNKSYLLYEWLDNWFVTYKKRFVSIATARIISNTIKEIKNNMPNTSIATLTTQQIQNFLNLYTASRKKDFIGLYLNACLQKAEDINLITKNPYKAVVKDKRVINIRQGYNLAEQKQILQAIRGQDIEPAILVYLCTGIRKNELSTFNAKTDIDREHNIIKIKSEKKRQDSYRLIDVTQKLIEIIDNNPEALQLSTDYIYRKLKTILNKLNIRTGLHLLRHTYATNHFYLGTPVKLVSSWLGHETIELTQNIYTHIDRTITREDIIKLYGDLYYRF